MKTPDEQVAENILAELQKQKILSDSILKRIKPKLSIGSLSTSDWKLAIEADSENLEASK